MHPLISFLGASLLTALDLGLLVLVSARIGSRPQSRQLLWLALAVALKLGLLFAGVAWLSHQAWNDRRAMIFGLLAPFALFIAWQALRLQLRAARRA